MISLIPQARARLTPIDGDPPPPVDDFKNSAFSSISDTIEHIQTVYPAPTIQESASNSISDTIDHSQSIFDPLTVQESVINSITSTISYEPA